jgi:CubicO group peptidase (beta-lactamase class C family)
MAGLGLVALLHSSPAPAQTFAGIDSAVRSGITRGVYPGAVVIVGRRDSVLYRQGYGHLTWNRHSPVADPDSTLWDLASLTKVVATTMAMMRLVERGKVALDAPVAKFLPRFTGGRKAEVTVRMLLDHTSGLPSYVEFFRLASGRDSAITLLYDTPLQRPPGSSAEYSDLNAMLLGLLIETVSGESLDRFATREVFDPLGLEQTMFHPPQSIAARTAPTSLWNGHAIRGVVNDQNALRLDGVSGHAGLFSTAEDLGRFARFWLGEGTLNGRRLMRPETIRLFLTPSPRSGTRLLGWDTPDRQSREPTPYGSLLSPSAYGHTGWTGTEIWIDPAKNLFLVFLTNRSFAPRIHRSIRELRAVRARVADAAVRAASGDSGAPGHR